MTRSWSSCRALHDSADTHTCQCALQESCRALASMTPAGDIRRAAHTCQCALQLSCVSPAECHTCQCALQLSCVEIHLQQQCHTCQCALQLSCAAACHTCQCALQLSCVSPAACTLASILLEIHRRVVLYNSPVYLQQSVILANDTLLDLHRVVTLASIYTLLEITGAVVHILANVLYNSPVYLQQRVILANVLYNSPVYLWRYTGECRAHWQLANVLYNSPVYL